MWIFKRLFGEKKPEAAKTSRIRRGKAATKPSLKTGSSGAKVGSQRFASQRARTSDQGVRKAAGHRARRPGAERSTIERTKSRDQRVKSGSRQERTKTRANAKGRAVEAVVRAGAAGSETVEKEMLVHVGKSRTQVAILENGALVEHYVSRKDHKSIAGNIYYGRVQNVLPGMEAAFVDIGTSKNGVLYVGDVQWDEADIDVSERPKIEEVLSKGDPVIVQVTKDPMGTKGPRLTTQITLPGRFVVLVPESDIQGISRRLPEEERERLRRLAKRVKPEGFGIIIRTAALGAKGEYVAREIERLSQTWYSIYEKALEAKPPTLLYEEPDIVLRVFRESFGPDFARVVVDDPDSYKSVLEMLAMYAPDFKEKVELYSPDEPLPLFEKYHIVEQLHKGLSRKVWLPSGGHIVIDRTEALTVIDVNTGKNVGKSNLEETVFQNNLEAAEEISRQLRLRDIGGIIIIDFIDMEIRRNREQVLETFRECLARDRTRTQVFEISELGLLEMTRKNVSEGLLEAFSHKCDRCDGRGVILEDPELD